MAGVGFFEGLGKSTDHYMVVYTETVLDCATRAKDHTIVRVTVMSERVVQSSSDTVRNAIFFAGYLWRGRNE
jgi:hypothetical protein